MTSDNANLESSSFGLGALFSAVDAERTDRGVTWTVLSREVGVAATTIRRFATAEDAEADGVLALIRWLGVAPEDFVDHGDSTRHAIALPNDEGIVRIDMDLVRSAEGSKTTSATRTTIQRLAKAAESSDQPIAALVRISET